MFKKKKCEKCGNKIQDKFSFCPYCGEQKDLNDEDFGMLGRNDFFSGGNQIKLPFGFNALFNSLVKNLSREFEAQMKNELSQGKEKKVKRDGISISISTFGAGAPRIKVAPMGNPQAKNEESEKAIKKNFTKEKIKKFSELEREEPKTSIRRLSNKLVYEIEMPGVKSAEDISITKLENSIEIKAIGEKAYAKIIPINLPIKNYGLSDGKLVLELGIKN